MKSLRRKDREINSQEAIELLNSAEYGVLSTVDEDNQPYGVPLNFVYKNKHIYFHCALSGQKLDNIENNAKVSLCIVGNTKVLPAEFSTEYASVMAFGVASEVEGAERRNALLWMIEKYSPAFIEEGKLYIAQMEKATKVFKIEINHISGKAQR